MRFANITHCRQPTKSANAKIFGPPCGASSTEPAIRASRQGQVVITPERDGDFMGFQGNPAFPCTNHDGASKWLQKYRPARGAAWREPALSPASAGSLSQCIVCILTASGRVRSCKTCSKGGSRPVSLARAGDGEWSLVRSNQFVSPSLNGVAVRGTPTFTEGLDTMTAQGFV